MEKGPSQVTHYIFTTFARGACPFSGATQRY